MTRSTSKYSVDTQLFINGFRDPLANEALQRFHRAFSPFEYLSAIVAQELLAGVKRPQNRKALERHVLGVFRRANRIFTPSVEAWHKSGDVLAAMAKQDGLEIARLSKSFANDVLLALSCREAGCILVTDNARDFQRIRRFVQFDFLKHGRAFRWAKTSGFEGSDASNVRRVASCNGKVNGRSLQ